MVAAPTINIKRVMSKPDQDNMPDDKRSRGDLDGNEATLAAVEQLSLDDGTINNEQQQQDNIPTTPPLMVGSWPPFSNMTIPKREMSTHSTLSDEEEALTSSPGGMRVRVQGTLNVPTSTTTNNNRGGGTPPRPPTMIATSNSETNLRRQISDGSSNSPPTNRNNNGRDNSNSNRSLHSRSSSEGNGTRGTSGPGGDNKSVGNWGWFEDVHAHENAFLPGISAGGRSRDNSMKKGRGTANRDGKKKGGGLFHIGSELMSNVIGAFEQPKQGKIYVLFLVYLVYIWGWSCWYPVPRSVLC